MSTREQTFTNGPWRVDQRGHNAVEVVTEDAVIAELAPGNGTLTNRANANLIAAAPELYKALKTAEQALDTLLKQTDLDLPVSAQASLDMAEIRDALAKAEENNHPSRS